MKSLRGAARCEKRVRLRRPVDAAAPASKRIHHPHIGEATNALGRERIFQNRPGERIDVLLFAYGRIHTEFEDGIDHELDRTAPPFCTRYGTGSCFCPAPGSRVCVVAVRFWYSPAILNLNQPTSKIDSQAAAQIFPRRITGRIVGAVVVAAELGEQLEAQVFRRVEM